MKHINQALAWLAIFFFYTAKPKWINPIFWARKHWDWRGERMLKKRKPDLYKLIEQTTQKSSSTGCGYGDYWSLYTHIVKHRPTNVVECGSGISTVVIAYALREIGGNRKFVSLEQAKNYYDNIVSIFPSEFNPNVELILSDIVDVEVENVLGFRYTYTPEDPIDFMYIGGPSLRKQFDNKELPKAINADVLFAPKSSNFTAILDQRIGTLWKLKSLMPDYDLRYSVMKRQTFIGKKPNATSQG